VLYVARCYVIDVNAGLCSHRRRRAADEQRVADEEQQLMIEELPMIEQAARVPSKPGRPVAKRDDGIYMTVTWTRPEDDGGADITSYVIKYGVRYTNVDDYATMKVGGDTTNFTFTDQLKEFMYYQFAVAAVNTAGQGEFSEFSEDVHTHYGK